MKKNWTPTQDAFRQFLHWLDEGVDSDGERYLEMRRRLALYFDRKNCLSADELADETLNRVARKLEEKGSITDLSPAHYCYIVAKFVFLEYLRRAEQGQVSVEELSRSAQSRMGQPASPPMISEKCADIGKTKGPILRIGARAGFSGGGLPTAVVPTIGA